MKKHRRSTVLVETRVKAERIYVHRPGTRPCGTRETFGMGFAGLALPLKQQRFLVQCAGSTSINVVSAGRLAGKAGPIEHYASARTINGRTGLYPSRYQSDEVLVAENLIKCHPYYRGLSALWMQQHVDSRDRRCRVANRAMRMVYQLVGGRQVWRGRGADREYLLLKLQEFHRVHHTPVAQTIRDLNEAFA